MRQVGKSSFTALVESLEHLLASALLRVIGIQDLKPRCRKARASSWGRPAQSGSEMVEDICLPDAHLKEDNAAR